MNTRVSMVPVEELKGPFEFLGEMLRDGEPLSDEFMERLRGAVEEGGLEVLAVRIADRTVGVAVLAYRPSVSVSADFASIEELHVRPEERRRGIGKALLEAVEERCAARSISYVEVQTDDKAAEFYAAIGYEEESDARMLSKSLPIINELTPQPDA